MSDVRLASNWPKSRVDAALQNENTSELVRFLSERYTERFFGPIECLKKTKGNEHGFGFAIMALCSLLIETIQCYREGLPSSYNRELAALKQLPTFAAADSRFKQFPGQVTLGDPFRSFFFNAKIQQFFPAVDGEEFYTKIRCGLLHQAQTKGQWRIIRKGSFWDSVKRSINRDEFSSRLKECFDKYLQELQAKDWSEDEWKRASTKIYWLAEVS